eukprot:ANDGO_01066.mRNA.1 Extracellular ribonuclease LE
MTRILFALAILSVSCSAALAWDFFVWAQGWPGSTCIIADIQHHPCNATVEPANGFLIHGLWPNNNDGSYPSNCNPNQPFDMSKVQSLKSELQEYWPSLFDGPLFLWEHEWEKHGTCAEDLFPDELSFFTNTLNLRKRVDVLASLSIAGIVPDDHSQVKRTDIIAALEKSLLLPDNAVMLECFWDKETSTQYLSEVRLCIGKSADLPFCSYPSTMSDNTCREDTVVIPAFRW